MVRDGRQRALLAFVTQASIACGGHAGDDETMRETVRQCLRSGVSIGAHPSYADRAGFGRRRVEVDEGSLTRSLTLQVDRLRALCAAAGAPLSYVKPHGQLYHDVESDEGARRALLAAAGALPIMVRARSPAMTHFPSTIAEAFADRAYDGDGRLRPRGQPGAILDIEEAVAQAARIAREGWAQSICVHGDGPHALEIARAVRGALRAL